MIGGTRSGHAGRPPIVALELLDARALQAMLDDELAEASRIIGRQLPTFFLEEKWLWQLRLDQLRNSPEVAPWLVRAVVLLPSATVVGHAGFHGPPDHAGMVEIGYTIAPEHRGGGCAHAAVRALVEEASSHPDVKVVRATVSPDNFASLAVIRRGQFVHVGEQWDDVDGLELVFEKRVDTPTAVSGAAMPAAVPPHRREVRTCSASR